MVGEFYQTQPESCSNGPAPSTLHPGWVSVPTTASPEGRSSVPRPRPAPTGRRQRCGWRPTRCTAPTVLWAPFCAGRKPIWERLRPSRPPPISWPGSSTQCCASANSTWTPAPKYYESQYRHRALRAAKQAGGTTRLPVGANIRCPSLRAASRVSGPDGVTVYVSEEPICTKLYA